MSHAAFVVLVEIVNCATRKKADRNVINAHAVEVPGQHAPSGVTLDDRFLPVVVVVSGGVVEGAAHGSPQSIILELVSAS